MWVWYCRPPIGAHFHPTPQPPPIPQQLGEKAHLRIAWSVAALRRPPLGGRTHLVLLKYIIANSHRSYLSLVYGRRNLVSLLGQMLCYYYFFIYYAACAAQYYNFIKYSKDKNNHSTQCKTQAEYLCLQDNLSFGHILCTLKIWVMLDHTLFYRLQESQEVFLTIGLIGMCIGPLQKMASAPGYPTKLPHRR